MIFFYNFVMNSVSFTVAELKYEVRFVIYTEQAIKARLLKMKAYS